VTLHFPAGLIRSAEC